jgi:hypothetical protein
MISGRFRIGRDRVLRTRAHGRGLLRKIIKRKDDTAYASTLDHDTICASCDRRCSGPNI